MRVCAEWPESHVAHQREHDAAGCTNTSVDAHAAVHFALRPKQLRMEGGKERSEHTWWLATRERPLRFLGGVAAPN
jgi:hypothetical protein